MENMDQKLEHYEKKLFRDLLKNVRKSIRIGRSYNEAGVGTRTPFVVTAGTKPPTLEGRPFLKTQFRNGAGFSKTLYTASTLRVEVGKDWLLTYRRIAQSGDEILNAWLSSNYQK